MANEVVAFNPTALPAFARNRTELSDTAKALAGSGGFSGKRLSIKGGVFRLLVAGKEVAAIDERFLDVVIVKAAPKIGRSYYEAKFHEGTPAAPDCWSANGDTPDTSVKAPQSSSCATCPQNVKGSGEGDSRACRFSQRVALALANDLEGDVLQLTIPATSIFGKEEGDNRPLQAYARYLVANKIGPDEVITRMRFDTAAANPKLFFKPMRWLTDEEFAIAKEKGETDDALQAVTMTVSQVDHTPPDLGGTRPKAAAQAAPAPAQTSDDEPPAPAPAARRGRPAKTAPAATAPAPATQTPEPTPEPTVRKAAADAAPAVKPAVAAVLDGWDD